MTKFLNKNMIYKRISVKSLKLAGMVAAIILNACQTNVNTSAQVSTSSATSIKSNASEKYPDFQLLVEQKKTNGEIISIGSKGLQSISIDGFDYPVNKLIKNQLQIEIPEVVPGKHELNVSLYLVKDSFSVPLIIPNLGQKIYVLLRLTIDENNSQIKKIEYGYDLDQNGIIDADLDRFESIGTKDFYAIDSNGVRQKIDAYINAGDAVPNEAVPPPGVVPSSSGQTDQKNDNGQPQVQVPEPPKPNTNGTDLYPLPPGGTDTTIPVPVTVDGDKGEQIPANQEPPIPLPQLPDLDQQ